MYVYSPKWQKKKHENNCIQNGQQLSQLNVSCGTESASISLKSVSKIYSSK